MEKDQFLLLVTKKFTGSITAEEELLLQNALKINEQYHIEYIYLEGFWKEKKMLPAEIQQRLAKIWSAIGKKEPAGVVDFYPKPNHSRIFSLSKILKIASVIILFASGAFYLFGLLNKKTIPSSKGLLSVISKQTSDTGRLFLLLPDGTKIWLNRSSRLAFNKDFGQVKREITLSGEAFFDVAKNERIPLIIHAQNIDIKVKGTAFNVCAYAKNRFIETALIRGLVEVTDHDNPDKTILLRPDEKLTIPRRTADSLQNKHLIHGNTNSTLYQPYVMESLNNEPSTHILPETAWMENKLIFSLKMKLPIMSTMIGAR